MANYQLGPVIGKIGGGAEIITEEVEIGQSESREWSLPEGWESGVIGTRGTVSNTAYGEREFTLFGTLVKLAVRESRELQGFTELPVTISTPSDTTFPCTVTLIRTA